jgi:hypothetical protein
MSISNTGLKESIDFINDLDRNLKSPFSNIENKVGNIAVDNIKEKTVVITGHLRDGNNYQQTSNDIIEVFNDVNYAVYVNAREEFFYLDENTQDEIKQEISNNILKE